MKTIVIDGQHLTNENMDGMHRFMLEILSRIDRMLESEDICIKLVHMKGSQLNDCHFKNIETVELAGNRFSFRRRYIPAYVKSVNGIYCSMSNNAAPCRDAINTLMDLIPLSPLARYPFKSLLSMKLTYRMIRRYAGRVVTISNESKNDIISKLGIDKNKITIVATGWEHIGNIQADETIFDKLSGVIKGQYYYAMGSQYPYKNFQWIREAAHSNPEVTFVVAGRKTNIDNGTYDQESNVIYTGYISDEVHKALLMHAKAFIHPSKLEGFGIPPMEALSVGTPIIIANASCLPEIYGRTAHYIDPDDANVNLEELLSEEVSSPEEILKKYTWDNAASQWMDIFKE